MTIVQGAEVCVLYYIPVPYADDHWQLMQVVYKTLIPFTAILITDVHNNFTTIVYAYIIVHMRELIIIRIVSYRVITSCSLKDTTTKGYTISYISIVQCLKQA